MTNKDEKQPDLSIDEIISQALESDEKEFIEHYDNDPSFIKFASANLRGKMGWLGWVSLIAIDIFAGLGIFCGYKAFHTSSTDHTVLWAAGAVICVIIVAMHKMWYWIEASRRSNLREIKRLELQVARMTAEA